MYNVWFMRNCYIYCYNTVFSLKISCLLRFIPSSWKCSGCRHYIIIVYYNGSVQSLSGHWRVLIKVGVSCFAKFVTISNGCSFSGELPSKGWYGILARGLMETIMETTYQNLFFLWKCKISQKKNNHNCKIIIFLLYISLSIFRLWKSTLNVPSWLNASDNINFSVESHLHNMKYVSAFLLFHPLFRRPIFSPNGETYIISF